MVRKGEDTYTHREGRTAAGGSRSVDRHAEYEDGRIDEIHRTSTYTNRYGETMTRQRTAEREGGYWDVEGEARTSRGGPEACSGRAWANGRHRHAGGC